MYLRAAHRVSAFDLFLHAIVNGGCSMAFQQIKRVAKVTLDPILATERVVMYHNCNRGGLTRLVSKVFYRMKDVLRDVQGAGSPHSTALLCALVRFFGHPRFNSNRLLDNCSDIRGVLASVREVSVGVIRCLFEASKGSAGFDVLQSLKDAIRIFKVCCPHTPQAVFGDDDAALAGGRADPERAHAELLLASLNAADVPLHLVVALAEAYLPIRPDVEVLEGIIAGLLAVCPEDGALPEAIQRESFSTWCTKLCYVFDSLSPHLSVQVRVRYLCWPASLQAGQEGDGVGGLTHEELCLLARLGHLACWAIPRDLLLPYTSKVETLFLGAVFAAVKDVTLALFDLLGRLSSSEGSGTESLNFISIVTFDRRRDWDEAVPIFLRQAPVIRRFPAKDAAALLVPLLLCKKVDPEAIRGFWVGVSSTEEDFIKSFEREAFALLGGSAEGRAGALPSGRLSNEERSTALAFLAGEIFAPAHHKRKTIPQTENQILLASVCTRIAGGSLTKSITDYCNFRPVRAARGQRSRDFD